jgi:hypothetical protein
METHHLSYFSLSLRLSKLNRTYLLPLYCYLRYRKPARVDNLLPLRLLLLKSSALLLVNQRALIY